MSVQFGMNVPGDGSVAPAALDTFGCRWARCVGYRDVDLRGWVAQCRDVGINVLLVLDRQSLGDTAEEWLRWLRNFYATYGSTVTYQIGNEPDGQGPSSWTMNPSDFSQLLRLARWVGIPPDRIVAGGLASGDLQYLFQSELGRVRAVAIHPYGQAPTAEWTDPRPNWAIEIGAFINGYRGLAGGRELWVTEYGFGGLDWKRRAAYYAAMTRSLLANDGVAVAMPFCWDDDQVPGFGLWDHGQPTDASELVGRVARGAGVPVVKTVAIPRVYDQLLARRGKKVTTRWIEQTMRELGA